MHIIKRHLNISLIAGIIFGSLLFAAVAYTVYAQAIVRTFNLIGDPDFKMHVIDMTNATTTEVITLPTTVGNHGQIRVGKIGTPTQHFVELRPASGDTINDTPGETIFMIEQNAFYLIVADEVERTWWVIGSGTQ